MTHIIVFDDTFDFKKSQRQSSEILVSNRLKIELSNKINCRRINLHKSLKDLVQARSAIKVLQTYAIRETPLHPCHQKTYVTKF